MDHCFTCCKAWVWKVKGQDFLELTDMSMGRLQIMEIKKSLGTMSNKHRNLSALKQWQPIKKQLEKVNLFPSSYKLSQRAKVNLVTTLSWKGQGKHSQTRIHSSSCLRSKQIHLKYFKLTSESCQWHDNISTRFFLNLYIEVVFDLLIGNFGRQ